MISLEDFWYVAAESKELGSSQILSRTILNEWIVLFRDQQGNAVALQDRCLHRGSQLSRGTLKNGHLICGYHGWTYDQNGAVINIPSDGPTRQVSNRCAKKFAVIERDDFIYVRLNLKSQAGFAPFPMPCYKKKGYSTLRLQNTFHNTVTNCAENFVDIPHTVFVHPKIFRDSSGEKLSASIERVNGSVKVRYRNEKKNLGIFSFFLNSSGDYIDHTDDFHVPNVTSVNYFFGGGKHFIITSQSVPLTENKTLVYTDLTYNYGIWNLPARPIIRWQAQKIIDQDVEILGNQLKTIEKYGSAFQNSKADMIHIFIESIQSEVKNGRDPRNLPKKEAEIEFWI